MPDAVIKAGTSVAEKILSESQKISGGTGSEFAEILDQKMEQADRPGGVREQLLEVFGLSPDNQIQAIPAEGLDVPATGISSNQEIRTHGKALDLLTEVNRGTLQMENLVDLMSSKKSLTMRDLIAGQMAMSLHVLHLEATKSVIEQATTGVKTLMNTNFA